MFTFGRKAGVFVAALLALPLLVPAGAVARKPGYRKGPYAGSKGAVELIGFKAGKRRITKLRFQVRKGSACTNGRGLVDTREGYDFPRIEIENRRFSVVGNFAGSNATAQFTLTGTLRGRKAWGTLRSVVTFDDGTVCDSGTLHWSASHS
jgi:hypothetical protein